MSNILNQNQTKVHEETSGGWTCLLPWAVMVSQMHAYVQIHQIIYIKYIQGFFVYQLGLNKTICQKWEGKYLTNGWGWGTSQICSVCQFPWCKHPHCEQCQAILSRITMRNAKLSLNLEDIHIPFVHTSSSTPLDENIFGDNWRNLKVDCMLDDTEVILT